MASTSFVSLVPLFLLSLAQTALPQDPSSPTTTIAQCGPSLLPLASCIPFVQGLAQMPVQMCCDNLRQIYTRQPHCLCLLLNNNLSSYPINTTNAQQLPDLCSLQVDISTCSEGTFEAPSNPPSSQVSFGKESNSSSTNSNSSIAASPVVSVAPRQTILGLGFHHSGVAKLNMKDRHLGLVLFLATNLCLILFS